MKNKPVWTVAILGVLAIAAYLVFNKGTERPVPVTEGVKVAAVLSLTGPAARFDAVKQKTLNLAIKRLKELYPKQQIDLKVFDAGGGPEATNVAVRQATNWGATYFLSGTSPTALAIAAQVRG